MATGGEARREFVVERFTWVTLPGTLVQVYHEGGTRLGCQLDSDNNLVLSHPEVCWRTRPLPPAAPAPE